jgi:hypothetical protein
LIASLGLLDLGIANGNMNFSINASLNLLDVDNPDTVVNEGTDGKLRLSDFSTAGFKNILSPTFNYSGSANLPIDGSLLTFLPPEYKPGGDKPLSIVVALEKQLDSFKPKLTYGVTNLQAALSSFKNFSLSDLVQVIQQVVELLKNSDIDGLNTVIPVVNQTPNEILNVVDSLAKAAEELLKGPDLNLINTKILELETLLTNLAGTPSQNTAVRDQIEPNTGSSLGECGAERHSTRCIGGGRLR